jgi:hypothetical protein
MKYLKLISRIIIPIFIWITFHLIYANYINFDNGTLKFIYYFFVTILVLWVSSKLRIVTNED